MLPAALHSPLPDKDQIRLHSTLSGACLRPSLGPVFEVGLEPLASGYDCAGPTARSVLGRAA